MPIQPKFTPEQFGQSVRKQVDRIEEAILRRMKIAGEEAINYARSINTYKDQTGNLRSSIGYVVYKNGSLFYQSSFNKVKDGGQGQTKGVDLAHDVAKGLPAHGFSLVVVAGMNYAFYVETKGYDVLTGAEIKTKEKLDRALKRIKIELSKR